MFRRLRCTPVEAGAFVVLVAGAAAAVGLLWWLSAPRIPNAAVTATPAPSESVEVLAGEVVVHVAGAVRRPGVYTLPGGSRVGDAVTAAGGPRRRAVLDGLNLARALTDGEQVLVPSAPAPGPSEAGAPAPSGSPGAAADPSTQKVSLNAATVADLDTLPDIGPVLAQRIIDHRDSIGGFTDIAQLRDVPGIGEKTFQSLVDLVTL